MLAARAAGFMMKDKTCFVMLGPTAVGKTGVAIELAQQFHTEIISADSRQCFKELNIGVAKPSVAELQVVKHWFINSHSIQEEINAKVFEDYSLQKVKDIFRENQRAVMVGGTGLYVKAFCEGMDEVPLIDPEVRVHITEEYKNKGIGWLAGELERQDPHFFAKGEMQNPQRMMRALEVKLSTGRSIFDFHSCNKKERDFSIIKIGLHLPKEKLHENINNRVDEMISAGLVDEVRSLLPFKHLNALQTVGYKEIFDHLDGMITLEQAVEQIKINTRQYAKRQMTWFKKDMSIKWFSPGDLPGISDYIKKAPTVN